MKITLIKFRQTAAEILKEATLIERASLVANSTVVALAVFGVMGGLALGLLWQPAAFLVIGGIGGRALRTRMNVIYDRVQCNRKPAHFHL
jgi:hypothetical protein